MLNIFVESDLHLYKFNNDMVFEKKTTGHVEISKYSGGSISSNTKAKPKPATNDDDLCYQKLYRILLLLLEQRNINIYYNGPNGVSYKFKKNVKSIMTSSINTETLDESKLESTGTCIAFLVKDKNRDPPKGYLPVHYNRLNTLISLLHLFLFYKIHVTSKDDAASRRTNAPHYPG